MVRNQEETFLDGKAIIKINEREDKYEIAAFAVERDKVLLSLYIVISTIQLVAAFYLIYRSISDSDKGMFFLSTLLLVYLVVYIYIEKKHLVSQRHLLGVGYIKNLGELHDLKSSQDMKEFKKKFKLIDIAYR